MERGFGDPSADEIFSTLEAEFLRVTGNTPPPSPGQTRCLYSFRVDVVVERIGRRYRLISLRPVRNPGGPYSPNDRRDHRTGSSATGPHRTGPGFPSSHPYDPPLRQQRGTGPTASQRPTVSSATSSFDRSARPTNPPNLSTSPSSSRPPPGNGQRPAFDRESHQRFMKKIELLIQAEERWKAQKARESQVAAESVRGSGGDRVPSAPR